jgi:hypothetical protein
MQPAFIALMVTVTSVSLLGCRDDMYQQAQKCAFDFHKTNPNVENMYLSEPAGRFIELCMRAAGYDFNYENKACANLEPDSPVVSEKPNGYCYVSYTKWERLIQKLESWLSKD